MLNKILDKYINNERGTDFSNYTPDSISQLLQVLGNPHKKIRTVHVAGTNGKGTTCYIIARVLENCGYKTGLFISPHLIRINERISINSSDISDEDLLHYVKKADRAATESELSVTYFDILTAAAFCWFNDRSTDIAIIETGLGGRLDSTSVITPDISIITDISMDHSHILGDTVEKITSEKCGIIKPGVPVVTTNTEENIINIIREFASLNNTPLFELDKTFHAEILPQANGLLQFRFTGVKNVSFTIELPLFPEHQVKNAAASTMALMLLKTKGFGAVTPEVITSTIKGIRIPGRFQKLSASPEIYFDPAHNISSLTDLLKGMDSLFPGWRKIIVLTMMKDKVTDEVLRLLESESGNIVYYVMDDPRAYIPGNGQFSLITGDRDVIIKRIKSENNNTVVLFTGTFRIYDFALETAAMFEQRIS